MNLENSGEAQERLKQSEAHLKMITESVPVLIAYADSERKFNPTWPPQQRKTPKFHTFSV